MSPRNATEIGQRRHYEFRGKKYPSVTTLLKPWPQEWAIAYGAKAVAERAVFHASELRQRLDSEDPVDWTLKWLKKAPFEKRDAAADAGTNLHAYLEGRLTGVITDDDTDDAGLSAGEVAIEQFLSVYRPDPLYVECQVFSVTDGWAGTADAFLGIYGRRYVFDLKTSPTALTDHKARLQLAAYRHGDFIGADDIEIGPVPTVDGALVLWVPRDHPERWSLIEVPADREEYTVFLAAKRLWQMYDSTKDTSVGEIVLPQVEAA